VYLYVLSNLNYVSKHDFMLKSNTTTPDNFPRTIYKSQIILHGLTNVPSMSRINYEINKIYRYFL